MVIAIVGADTEWPVRTFTVHKNLLCRTSDYFDKALNGPFLESSKMEPVLADNYQAAFEIACHWICTGLFYQQVGKKLNVGRGSVFAVETVLARDLRVS